jgi:PTH2 family peptidyl-tRNA hydrolase
METKQVIVIRKDLKMRKGKMCAQAAHASMKVILDQMFNYNGKDHIKMLNMTNNKALYHWINGLFTKVVVGCDSKEELYDLAEKASFNGIMFAIIEDSGKTEFHDEPTITALAIGPDDPEKIDKITGHLKLL